MFWVYSFIHRPAVFLSQIPVAAVINFDRVMMSALASFACTLQQMLAVINYWCLSLLRQI